MFGALGCNIAWGLVDAVMYLLATLTERRRNRAILNDVRSSSDATRSRALILDALPPMIAATLSESAVIAELPTGTTRVLEPLPSTLSSSASKSIDETSRLTSSSARSPHA